MNLLHLSITDITGGASQATYQLHRLLQEAGHRSVLAVRWKDSSDPDVVQVRPQPLRTCHWSERIERARSRLSGGYRVTPFPFHCFNRDLAPVPNMDAVLRVMPRPDIVILHWITNMLTVADIRRLADRVQCPMIWVLMDMEPLTGGCHYSGACTHFRVECKSCPQLNNGRDHDWAWRTWHKKHQLLSNLPITFITATKWIGDRLTDSKLFGKHRMVNIPLPMSKRMRPLKKGIAREILELPADKKIILAGSYNIQDPRKGIDHLIKAAHLLAEQEKGEGYSFQKDEVLFVLLGKNNHELSAELPFPSRNMGYVQSEVELALAYQAADVFACSSLQDAGPMMISQAMLCGTPVVAFDTGIVPELIISRENGYIARLGDTEDFSRGLKAMLSDDGSAGRRAAEIASRFHDPHRILILYEELMNQLIKQQASKY